MDKVYHFLVFFTATTVVLLVPHLLQDKRTIWVCTVSLFLAAIGAEHVQHHVYPNRSLDIFDGIANLTGFGTGVGMYYLAFKELWRK